MTATYSRDAGLRLCGCGHGTADHDPWPECERCDCTEYGEAAPAPQSNRVSP